MTCRWCGGEAGKNDHGVAREFCNKVCYRFFVNDRSSRFRKLDEEKKEYFEVRNKLIMKDMQAGATRPEILRKYRIGYSTLEIILNAIEQQQAYQTNKKPPIGGAIYAKY